MLRWNEIANDPNAPEVLAVRAAALAHARGDLVDDRVSYLCELAPGKRVLDVGVVAHFFEASASDNWLHGKLCGVAKSCVGVDVLAEDISRLRQKGYDVRQWDVVQEPLNEKFELIIMGELIEHVPMPYSVLCNAARMLEDDGTLVLTTPNPWYVNAIIKNLKNGTPFTDSADHICWYDPSTLYELGQRCGFELRRFRGARAVNPNTMGGKLFFRAAPMLVALGLNPLVFCKTILYELDLPTASASAPIAAGQQS